MDAMGRPCLICQPSSRTGENPPYGMIGGMVETSASFEARYAPLSHPTEGGERRCCHDRPKRARSWKRRIRPRKIYRTPGSPLLGEMLGNPTKLEDATASSGRVGEAQSPHPDVAIYMPLRACG